MKKILVGLFFALLSASGLGYSQILCETKITSIAQPNGSPLELPLVFFQSAIPWSDSIARVRNVSEKGIVQLFVELSPIGSNNHRIWYSASLGEEVGQSKGSPLVSKT
jgi:hypothetical protein